MSLELKFVSAMEKVMPLTECGISPLTHCDTSEAEPFRVQLAYRAVYPLPFLTSPVRMKVRSDFGESLRVYEVRLLPSDFPAIRTEGDTDCRDCPGLFPELLAPCGDEVGLAYNQWRAFYFEVPEPRRGEYSIEVEIEGEFLRGSARLGVTVSPLSLPISPLIATMWSYYDAYAMAHSCEIYSDAYFDILSDYLKTYVGHGFNVLFAPLFDVRFDFDRDNCVVGEQTVGVERGIEGYRFDFTRLEKLIACGRRAGLEYIEFSHLFSAWGAKCAVRVADRAGNPLFGPDTDGMSEEYLTFLKQLLRALSSLTERLGCSEKCFLHLSDEPRACDADRYAEIVRRLQPELSAFRRMEALSDLVYTERGLVDYPVVISNKISPFLERKTQRLFAYYCWENATGCSNRAFGHSLARVRAIGVQLYRGDCAGFLHWGYNAWFRGLTRRYLDAFSDTSAGGVFPSGDAWVVYPGGAVSIRLKALHEALIDERFLRAAEKKLGRAAVVAKIDELFGKEIRFDNSSSDNAVYDRIRRWAKEQLK